MKPIVSFLTLLLLLLIAYPILLLATPNAYNTQQANFSLLKSCANGDSEKDNVEDVNKSALDKLPFPTALITSCQHDKGEDINTKEEEKGHTPLMVATIHEKIAIVKYLLDLGADSSIVDRDGYNAPHLSAVYGTANVMEALIEAGVEEKYADTLRVLLRHGVPYNAESKNGLECEHLAGDKIIVNVLKEKSGIDVDSLFPFDEDEDESYGDYYYGEDDEGLLNGDLLEDENNNERDNVESKNELEHEHLNGDKVIVNVLKEEAGIDVDNTSFLYVEDDYYGDYYYGDD